MTHRQFMVIELPEGIEGHHVAACMDLNEGITLKGFYACDGTELGAKLAETIDKTEGNTFEIDADSYGEGL